MLGIVRIRGRLNLSKDIEDTMQMMGLKKKFWFTAIDENNKAMLGMLKKVKDYVTYGKIDETFAKKVLGDSKHKGLKPPKDGFKGSTRQSGSRGELGSRDNIQELIERMI